MVTSTRVLRAMDRRDVHPLLQVIRQWFYGRPYKEQTRWREDLSPKSTYPWKQGEDKK
uniref:Uncharacterized protein n=1 Tax=Tetranychus urticae TaxID=32264 RepID=T1K923_TETUR